MEAKDLMIGDWILGLVEDNEQVGKVIAKHPARIIKIEENGDYVAQCPYTFDEMYEGDGTLIEDFLWYDTEPIPLTAEILEKNGLRKITLDGEKGSKQDYYIDTHFIGYYNMNDLTRVHASPIVYDIKQKWLFVDDKATCRVELMCPYVHILQHALRLCGIDKTIEL